MTAAPACARCCKLRSATLPALTCGAGSSSATLDFIASTATLDRYHEVIEPAGWRLESYRRNPVFQNAHNYGDILFHPGQGADD